MADADPIYLDINATMPVAAEVVAARGVLGHIEPSNTPRLFSTIFQGLPPVLFPHHGKGDVIIITVDHPYEIK